MIDDYAIEQPIAHRILKNFIIKNKCSHAYLFELNDYSNGYNFALSYAKFLLCPNCFSNNLKCNNCSICKQIDDNNYLELKIIEPDGQWIKKEQLDELQKDFNTKSLIGNRKIYIIKNAEKMNASSSNSLLKFLEEPPENVIAILITNNSYQLLNTIVSRCQIISLKNTMIDNDDLDSLHLLGDYLYNDSQSIDNFICEFGIKYIDTIIEYTFSLLKNKEGVIALYNKTFVDIFNDRNKILVAFQLLVLYYKDVLHYKLNEKCYYFKDYIESIKLLSQKYDIFTISKIIKIIIRYSEKIKYNVNINLLMDKISILLSEV